MSMQEVFAAHAAVVALAAQQLPPLIEELATLTHKTVSAGHKILACGNGGSAAHAQHLVAELVGRCGAERHALPAIALTADGATLTALANDYGYEHVFARQVEALARADDLLFAISTSGNSRNVVLGAQTARRLGCRVAALTGARGGDLARHADIVLQVPSADVARIQEVHTLCIHAIAAMLDGLIRQGGGA